jgi:ComEC/Rec2-related protein
MNKRPLLTAGMILLLGELSFLQLQESLIMSALLFSASIIVILISNRYSEQKKCSYLLLFCCLAAGMGIGAVSEYDRKEITLIVGEYVHVEGKATEVRESEKSLSCVLEAGNTKVVVYLNNLFGYDNFNKKLRVGEYLSVEGILEKPEGSTNPGNFDMAEYYSGKGISGIIYAEKGELTGKKDYILYGLGRVREKMRDSLYRYFREDRASLIATLLIGEKSGLDKNQKLLYQKNGLAHILAISGMHIALIALGIEKMLELFGMGRRSRNITVMVMVFFYGIMTGFAASTVRAVIMLIMRYTAFFFKRSADTPTDMMTALLILAIINPASVSSAGLRMSFVAAAAMYVSDRIYINYFGWRRGIFFKERFGINPEAKASKQRMNIDNTAYKKMKEGILRTALSTLIINAFTAPLVINYYYEIYPYSMLLGALIIPTITLVIIGGFIVAILGTAYSFMPADIIVRITARLTTAMLRLYESICGIGLRLPFSGINTGHTNIASCLIYYMILLILTAVALGWGGSFKRNSGKSKVRKLSTGQRIASPRIAGQRIASPRIAGLRIAGLRILGVQITGLYLFAVYFLLVLFLGLTSYINKNCSRLVILDVGQGMASLVHFKDGRNYLLDGGSTSRDSVGEYVIIPALKYYGMSDVTGIFVSHTDEDHINGLIELAELSRLYRIKIGGVYMAEGTKKDDNFMALQEMAGFDITGLFEGDIVDGCFEVIYPELNDGKEERTGNDYSLVVRLEMEFDDRRISILFPGDISSDAEQKILDDIYLDGKPDIDSDILIVPHHGSKYSSSSEFLRAVSCKAAVISCGRNNIYGHPAPETLDRLEECGVRIYRTDLEGAIVIQY